jgi:hypothetical protein
MPFKKRIKEALARKISLYVRRDAAGLAGGSFDFSLFFSFHQGKERKS